MTTQADASVYAATLEGGQAISTDLRAGRKGWVQVADGSLKVNGIPLFKGDGLAIDGSGSLTFEQGKAAEFLFFDLVQ
jgi:redox-sensitive bicupin YhaK (pirin superfamily)